MQQPAAPPHKGLRKGRLLILNVRGFGRADPLYEALAELGWQITILDLPESLMLRWYARLRSFRPTRPQWRRRFDQMASRISHTAFAFKYNSRRCERLINRSEAQYDLILQGGGMFAPRWPPPFGRYVLLCDCTTEVSETVPQYGPGFRSSASARRWYALEQTLYRQASAVFSTSNYVTRSFVDDYGVDPARVVTVGEGCSLESTSITPKEYDGKTILFVGYEFARKGGEVLLAAFERVAAAIPGATLLLAGPPRIGCRLPDGAQLLGRVSRQQLSELYERASLFVMPSLFEPFGLVFLEAMSHKIPCIGSDRCAMPEIIVDGETGIIVPAGDADTLAARMIELLRDPDRMRRMGERGRERVREVFTWSAVARRIDRRLTDIVYAPAAESQGTEGAAASLEYGPAEHARMLGGFSASHS